MVRAKSLHAIYSFEAPVIKQMWKKARQGAGGMAGKLTPERKSLTSSHKSDYKDSTAERKMSL